MKHEKYENLGLGLTILSKSMSIKLIFYSIWHHHNLGDFCTLIDNASKLPQNHVVKEISRCLSKPKLVWCKTTMTVHPSKSHLPSTTKLIKLDKH